MNNESLLGLTALAALSVLLGCSTPKPAGTPSSALPAPPPEFELRTAQLIPPLPAVEPPGQLCLLGTSCLAMDPRPFEPCLLSTRHCRDKAAESMQVAPPREAPAPGAPSVQFTKLGYPR